MIRLEQIPFESRVRFESNPDQTFDIVAMTWPEDDVPVYVIEGIEEGEALLITQDYREGFQIQIRKPMSTL